jgi:serine/threonine-protein kinase
VGEEQNSYYLAMEFLQGQNLASILNRRGLNDERFDFACIAYVLAEVLAGMEYAHELADYDGTPLRMVHRDLSPPNVFVTYDGQVKVLDFGIAKALDSTVETRTGIILGKTRYMAPEQALGEQLDCRADLYAVGVMLWEAAAGRRRWANLKDPEIVRELVTNEFVDLPGAADRGLPEMVDEIVARALAPDREDRYHSAADFRNDLESMLLELKRDLTGRHVGKIVAEIFAAERGRLEREVQLKIGKIDGRGRQLEWAASHDGSGSVSPNLDRTTDDATSIAPITTGAWRLPPTLSSRLKLKQNAIPITISLTVIFLGLFAGWHELHAPSAPQTSAAAPQRPQSVSLRLSATPERANLFLDGARLAGNPAVLERAPDAEIHELRAEAPGHRTEVRALSLARDLEVHLQLRAEPEKPAEPPVQAEPEKSARAAVRAEPRAHATVTPTQHERSATPPIGRAAFPESAPSATSAPPASSSEPKEPVKVKLDVGNPWQ